MLSQPRYSPDQIKDTLKVGDRVDWLGQPARVIKIDTSNNKPLLLRNLLSCQNEVADFAEINDIENTVYRSLVVNKIAGFGRKILAVIG